MERMSDDNAVAYPTQTVVVCDACGVTVEVKWYCKQCQGSLCSSCKDDHRAANLTKRHSVVLRTAKVLRAHGPAKIVEQCRQHPEKEISAYCDKCKVPCCISCLAERHKHHDFTPIDEKYLTAERRLDKYTKQLEKEVIPKIYEVEKQVKSEIKCSDQQRKTVKEEIKAFREEIKQVVDEEFDNLIDSLYQQKSNLNEKLNDAAKQKTKVNDLIHLCTSKIREGKLELIEYIPPTPASLLPTLSPSMSSRPVFVPDMEIIDIIRNKVGSLTCNENLKQQGHDLAAHAKLCRLLPQFDKVALNIRKISSLESKIHVTTITTAANNMAWVTSNGRDTMYLYSGSGDVVKFITVKKGVEINDTVISPSGEMIVTNYDKKVRCVSVKGKVSTLIDTAPYHADGVCLTDRGETVVCMNGQYERNHVAVYSSAGRKKIREIRCQDDRGKRLMTNPYRVVQNGEDLCVVNYGDNVICVDERGDVRWVYDGTQAKHEDKFYPLGICRDKYHNLLVTDHSNNSVHYVDRVGQLIQVILTQKQIGLPRHWGISIDDETGQVWVGNDCNDVVLATYLNND